MGRRCNYADLPAAFYRYPQPLDPAAPAATVKDALRWYYARYDCLPACLRVNRQHAAPVAAALAALRLEVPVTVNGGTLLGELELGTQEVSDGS